MPQPSRIAVVTGANKGIGLAIVRQLALRYASSPLASSPSSSASTTTPGSFLIYLTARDRSRGEAAVAALQSDPDLKHARCLVQHGGPADIRFAQLDLSAMPPSPNTPSSTSTSTTPSSQSTSSPTLEALTAFLRREHGEGSLDLAINNAGIALDGFDSRVVHDTLHTNYWRTHAATLAWLPLMRPAASSRIVTVASAAGRLAFYSPELQARFRKARRNESDPATTATGDAYAEPAHQLMREFEQSVERGDHESLGWPTGKAYAVSKAGVIALTGATARHLERQKAAAGGGEAGTVFRGTLNCCCPGWVVTDMTKGRGFKTPDQGADLPVRLALGELGEGVTGEFWADGKVQEW